MGRKTTPAKHPLSFRASAYALAAPTDYRLGRHAISYEDNLEIPFQKTMKDFLRILFFRRGKTRSYNPLLRLYLMEFNSTDAARRVEDVRR